MTDLPEKLPQVSNPYEKRHNPDDFCIFESGILTERDLCQSYWVKALNEIKEYQKIIAQGCKIQVYEKDRLARVREELASANKRIEELEYSNTDLIREAIRQNNMFRESEAQVARLTEAQRVRLEYIAILEIEKAQLEDEKAQLRGKLQDKQEQLEQVEKNTKSMIEYLLTQWEEAGKIMDGYRAKLGGE
jgi:predicted  nucleic acid-binding Zn-ribbon protein